MHFRASLIKHTTSTILRPVHASMLRLRFFLVVAVLAGGSGFGPRRRDALRRVWPGRRRRRGWAASAAAATAAAPTGLPARHEERGQLLLRQRDTAGTMSESDA